MNTDPTDGRHGAEAGADPAIGPPEGGGARRSLTRPLLVGGVGAVIAAVVLSLALFSGGGDDTAAPADIDQLLFITEDGSTGTLADHAGEALVVNFFASWCAPCRAELPDIEAAYETHGGRVTFIGVNQDLTESTWRSFVEETEITFPTVFQPDQELWEALDLFAMPSTILITPEGEIVYEHSGIINEDQLDDLINDHLLEDL